MNGNIENPATHRIVAITLISVMFSVAFAAFPGGAAADISSVRTQQLLPVGGNTCTPLSAYDFAPYVYDKTLHSFAFTVSNSSYVALAGSVGGTSVPFYLMTRHGDAMGALRVHVDIPTTPVSKGLLLSVTLVSAQGGGQPVCMSTVSMMVSGTTGSAEGSVSVSTTAPISITSVTTEAPSVPNDATGSAEGSEESTGVTETIAKIEEEGRPTSVPEDEGVVKESTVLSIGSLQNKVVELCATGNRARVWIVLLAVYAVIAVIAVLAQFPASWAYSTGQRTATLLTPLILLLGFWYFAESCRPTLWAPIAAILVALAGLAGIYREYPQTKPYVEDIFNLMKEREPKVNSASPPSSVQATMITPPPLPKDSKGTPSNV